MFDQATARDHDYDDMVLEEFNRLVSVREGANIEKLPVYRASARAINLKAAKGGVKAYAAVSAKREAIEYRRRAEREDFTKAIFEYKEAATLELRRRQICREPGPEIIPHPDDIAVNPLTGSLAFNGPVTVDQKMAQDLLVSRWPELQRAWGKSLRSIMKNSKKHRDFEKSQETDGSCLPSRGEAGLKNKFLGGSDARRANHIPATILPNGLKQNCTWRIIDIQSVD